MRTKEELEELMTIDRNHLELELEKQPQLFYEVCKGYADVLQKRDIAKFLLGKVRADIALTTRSDAAANFEKVTEATIAAKVDAHPAVEDQMRKLSVYESDLAGWKGLMNAFAQRNDALRDTVRLYNIGYYGSSFPVSNEKSLIEAYKAAKDRSREEEKPDEQ